MSERKKEFIPLKIRKVLEKRLEEEKSFPPTFKFTEPGQVLIGKLIEIGEMRPSTFDPSTLVKPIVIQTSFDEKVTVWLQQKGLQEAFERASPSIGDIIAIKYVGLRGRFKVFRVEVIGGDEAFDLYEEA